MFNKKFVFACPKFHIQTICLILFFFISLVEKAQISGQAQISVKLRNGGSVITFTSDKGTVCNLPPKVGVKYQAGFLPTNQELNGVFDSIPPGAYFKAKADETVTLTINQKRGPGVTHIFAGAFWMRDINAPIDYSALNGPTFVDFAVGYNDPTNQNRVVKLTVKGAQKGVLIFDMHEYGTPLQGSNNADGYTYCNITLPFVVEGVMDPKVDSLGTTVEPKIPYLVLHAPPGNQSMSKFLQIKENCRDIADTYADNTTLSTNVAVKIGVKGSAGIFVTTDYEISAKFKAGVSSEALSIQSTSKGLCMSSTTEFETASLLGPMAGSGDVFIGFGQDLAYGKYRFVKINQNTCKAILDTGLIFAPTGTPRNFTLTQDGILADIATQTTIMKDVSRPDLVRNNADNQIKVWKQVLAMNEANINNPNNTLLSSEEFNKGNKKTFTSSISVLNTNSIQVEHAIGFNAGIEAVVEVGGSGFNSSFDFTTTKRFGKSINQTNDSVKVLSYSLADNDDSDIFYTRMYRDPMYGTPIFKTLPTSQTSCPYQGGYPLDQPKLKHSNTNQNKITILNAPLNIDSAAIFPINIINESKESRTYLLKVNPNSNPNFLKIADLSIPKPFPLSAGQNLPIKIEVKRNSLNTEKANPNLELVLYSDCEPSISSSIYASVYFGPTVASEDKSGNISLVQIFPNPASNNVILKFALAESAKVTFTVYDILGQRQLISQRKKMLAGQNTEEINVQSLVEGIYLCDIQSDHSRITKKLVIKH